MTFTTTYKQGDVVMVPQYPYTDQPTSSQRPAIVISCCDCDCPVNYGYILVAVTRSNADSCSYPLTGAVLSQSGLVYQSYVKTGALFTIHAIQIKKRMGSIPANETKKIIGMVLSHIWRELAI